MVLIQKTCSIVAAAILFGGIFCGCSQHTVLPKHAQHIALDEVDNMHRVSPELYRSGQPEPEGFTKLEQMGVRSVLNLSLNPD